LGRVAYGPVAADDVESLLDAGFLGGAAHRNAETFAEEFAALCEELSVAPQGKPASRPQPALGPDAARALT